jgi:sugar phosphate isomerase/epimerase
VRRLLSLAAGTLPEFTPAVAVAAAAAAGWPGCGVWFDPQTWTERVAREVRRRLDDAGMLALDIEPVIASPDGDPGEALVEAGAAIGARFVLFTSRDPDRGRTIDRFARICDLAAPAGMTVVCEFLPIFTLRCLADALDVVKRASRPNAGVLVDNLHLSRSGGSVEDLDAAPRGLVPYLQIADAPAERPTEFAALLDEAMNGRSLPGHGGLPIAPLIAAVPEVPISFEVRSRSLRERWPDATERARGVHRAVASLAW